MIAYRVQEGTSSEIDYAELARLTGRFAAALLRLGVKRGDTVAVQLPSRLETLPIGLACAQVRCAVLPADDDLPALRDVAHAAADRGPRVHNSD